MLTTKLLALSLVCLPLTALFARPGGEACRRAAEAQAVQPAFDYDQELFCAVLEGCYADGVQNEVVDKLVAFDDTTHYPANFVQGCPICMPAFNALRSYRSRTAFHGYKELRDSFGAGLAETEVRALTSADIATRQAALQALTERWTTRHMNRLRLTPEERSAFRMAMEEMRKKGMASLAGLRASGGSYAQMKTCPLCEGANDAFGYAR